MIPIALITQRMIALSGGSLHDVSHFLKVHAYARTIAELEGLDVHTRYVLEIAAITHDIACPLCREKYGCAAGPLQEKEGDPMVRSFLASMDIPPDVIERVAFLVGHHHSLCAIDGPDHQILIEADYLVNAHESGYSDENIRNFCKTHFKTASGTSLLKDLYPAAFQ